MGLFDFLKKKESTVTSPQVKICAETQKLMESAKSLGTDLVIMDASADACPDCAKFQGRVYSLSGGSRIFPKLPYIVYTEGQIHKGCNHYFWAYIHGVNDPDLEYTLSVHKLQDPQYGRDIIAFSNRPFTDDRTEACKKKADRIRSEIAAESILKQQQEISMAQLRVKLAAEEKDFQWLQENIPDKCPKSISGYRRMKTQNTKNYQLLKQLAADLGREI